MEENEALIPMEELKQFVYMCEADRVQGLHVKERLEGERLADNFRACFPDVSDRDLGSLIVVFAKAFALLGSSSALDISDNISLLSHSYGYCAGSILKSAAEMHEL